ncbi:MAG TPA: polymer-forming cytoskeletal protein [Rhizomicrobium sp.]|jgi:cytoskeletal protein CcmA (bactofilin family)|nr:polymer-forming cytoskeletal protein [Rhizomicrobium sp.]
MFSNKNRDRDGTEVASSMPSSQPQPAKRAGRAGAPSIISADLTVNGTLTSAGDVQIDGCVEGDVHSAGLVIGEKALIRGEIVAEDVTVRGRVNGSIRARKVLLCSSCHVEGNILHEAFAVEAGAFFEGNCRHSDNPLSDEAARPRAAESKQAAAANPTSSRPDPTPSIQPARQSSPEAVAMPLRSGA